VTVDREQLKRDLKALVIAECQKKDLSPGQIGDDDVLIGGPHDFDSLDALQISMAVQQRYGKRIDRGNKTRHALKSINALADFILS
jgi:acyl carrier protein